MSQMQPKFFGCLDQAVVGRVQLGSIRIFAVAAGNESFNKADSEAQEWLSELTLPVPTWCHQANETINTSNLMSLRASSFLGELTERADESMLARRLA